MLKKLIVCSISLHLVFACSNAEKVAENQHAEQHTEASNANGKASAPDYEQAYSKFLEFVAQKQLLPGYQDFHSELSNTLASVQSGCADMALNTQELAQLQGHWRAAMNHWQSVNWFKMGPVAAESRHSRIQYWPDGNQAVKRGVEKLLLSKTPVLDSLANQNVGAQGLPALEVLLFEPAVYSANPADKYCEVVQAIVSNLNQMATEVVAEWQKPNGFAAAFMQGQEPYSGTKDAMEELLSNWFEHFILLKDNKMTYPLGISAPGIPQLAESPFADHSMQNLRVNLAASEALINENEAHNLVAILENAGKTALAQQIKQQWLSVASATASLPVSFTELLDDDAERAQLLKVKEEISNLQQLLAEDMTKSLQLTIGFNALDGD